MLQEHVPGTVMPYSEAGGMFAMFRPLIQATDGLTLGQVCAITGLEPSTVQNWVKRGFVAHPVRKKYHERQLARILLISALRESMQIDRIGELMALVNGSADDTGDDIVSEEQLYDYLCEAIGQTDALTLKNIPLPANLPQIKRIPHHHQRQKPDQCYNRQKHQNFCHNQPHMGASFNFFLFVHI